MKRVGFYLITNTIQFEKEQKIVLATLALANMIVNLPEELEERMAMRAEFRSYTIEDSFNRILDDENLDIDEIWDLIKSWKGDAFEDEEDYDDKIYEITQMTTAKNSYVDMLDKRIPPHLRRAFDEITKRLIFLPTDSNIGQQKWLLVERICRQLTSPDGEHLTFDNKNWISIDDLLQPLAQEASAEKQNHKMFEDKTKLEHEIMKLERQLAGQKKTITEKEHIVSEKDKLILDRDAEISNLKIEKIKQAKEAAEVILNTKEDMRLVDDEKKEVEAKFRNLSGDIKKYALDIVAKLQRERGRARSSEMALAEAKRENLKIQQEREEDKLFLASKLRSDMEAEKKEAIFEVKKEIQDERERLEKRIGEKFQKDIDHLKKKC
jgi:uncharacterized coiled-coil protein SlyX